MTQPIPITPEQPPQWAVEAAKEMALDGCYPRIDGVAEATNYIAAIIARHAPQAPAVSDTEMLDWLEKHMLASGYPVHLLGLSRAQTNGTTIITGVGSGPFEKRFDGPSGPQPLRSAILAAMKGEREGKK